jgi:acyl carrier protein
MTAGDKRSAIIAQLREILREATDGRVKADQVSEDSRILDTLGLSSLELLELRFGIETTWDIVLEDQDVARLQVVSDVIDLIGERTAGRAGT